MVATPIPATTGYRAGIKQDDVLVAYGIETAWGVPPSAGQYLRLTGHSLAAADQRKRTNEFDQTISQSGSFRTSFQAGGSLNGLLSAGTWDDFFASVFTSTWSPADGSMGDGSAGSGPTGFPTKPTFLTLEVNNGGLGWLQYSGCLVSKFALSLRSQSEITVQVDLLAKTETVLTAPGFSTYVNPNAQPVFKYGPSLTTKMFNGAAISAIIDQMDLAFARTGSGRQYGDGTFGAVGMDIGIFEASGSFRLYFNSMATYQAFTAQTKGVFTITLTDDVGNIYAINLESTVLTTPTQPISSRGGDLMQTFVLMPEKQTGGTTAYLTRTPLAGVKGSFSYAGS